MPCDLPLTAQYRHLGGIIAAKKGMLPEIRARLSRARSAERLPLALRTQVFQATVMAALQWGVGTWPKLNVQESKAYEKACWEMYLCLIPTQTRRSQVALSHEEILLHLDVDHPEALFASAHARHYLTMVQSAPEVIWSIVQQDVRTQQAYHSAFEWLSQFLERDTGLPNLQGNEELTKFLLARPGTWRAAVKRALKRSRQWHQIQAKVYLWHRQIYSEMEEEHMIGLRQDPSLHAHLCLICRKAFATKKAWFLHTSQKHGYQTMHGEAARGTVCLCCAKCYPTRNALMAHLRYSPTCCAFLWSQRQQPECEQSRHPQAVWTYTGATPVSSPDVVHRDIRKFHDDLDEALHAFDMDVDDVSFYDLFFDRLVTVCIRPMHFPDIVAGFHTWMHRYETTSDSALQDVLDRVNGWLREQPQACDSKLSQMHVCAEEKVRHDVCVLRQEPRCRNFLPRQVVFLHLFSGRRRHGDVQTALENLTIPAGCMMLVVSVDIVVSREKCDLMAPEQQKKWLQLARGRHSRRVRRTAMRDMVDRKRNTSP